MNQNWVGWKKKHQISLLFISICSIFQVGADRTSVTLKTTDEEMINVSFPEAIEQLQMHEYLEVYGKVQSKNTLSAVSYVHFPSSMTDNFCKDWFWNYKLLLFMKRPQLLIHWLIRIVSGAKTYNETLAYLLLLGDKKWKMSSYDTPL